MLDHKLSSRYKGTAFQSSVPRFTEGKNKKRKVRKSSKMMQHEENARLLLIQRNNRVAAKADRIQLEQQNFEKSRGNSMFSSRTLRFKGQVPPSLQNQESISFQQHTLQVSTVSPANATLPGYKVSPSNRVAPFDTTNRRFPAEKNSIPGPGHYAVDQKPKTKPAKRTDDRYSHSYIGELERENREKPGPGDYTGHASLLKKTFNATLPGARKFMV
jgi:hypothetical protein